MSEVFTPFSLKDVTLRNRIAVPPMCQYSAVEGMTNGWHRAYYPSMARGGAGLVIVEATGVSPEGRITPGCTGIWNDAQAELLAEIAASIKAEGAVPGIQIGHAGRKASANLPWEGDDHIPAGDPRGWETIAPSAVAFGGILPRVPREMILEDIELVKGQFVSATRGAREAGFEWLELHFAHGYLAQSFFSQHSNLRTDAHGGDFKGRSRFLLDTLAAVRNEWPERLPLTIRFGVIEYDGRDEETVAESIELAKHFRDGGMDLLNVSIGFTIEDIKIPWGPAFLAPVAKRVRNETGLKIASAWCLDGAKDVERAVADGQMDIVMVGRAHLANPHYAYNLALALGEAKPSWKTVAAPYAYWLEKYRGVGTGSEQ